MARWRARRAGQAMIAELGHFAMILALFLAVAQSGLGLVGAARDDGVWMAGAGAAIAQFAGLTVAFAALTTACGVRFLARDGRRQFPFGGDADALQGGRRLGQSRLDAAVGADLGAVRRHHRAFRHGLAAPLRAVCWGCRAWSGSAFCCFWRLPTTPSRGWRGARTAPISTCCCRTRARPSTTRPCCISAMLAYRWPFPSPSRR